MRKHKAGEIVTLNKEVDVDIKRNFRPGVQVKIKNLCDDGNPSNEHYTVHLLDDDQCYWWICDFEIQEVDEKESTSAWLKENKWFIRTGSPEKSNLVQEWLFEHGMKWQWYNDFNNNTNEKLLTNTYDDGDKNNYILFAVDSNKTNAQEIKIEFETIVKSVQLPQVLPKKTEAQLKLEELQRTIEDAQRQIAGLKEEI